MKKPEFWMMALAISGTLGCIFFGIGLFLESPIVLLGLLFLTLDIPILGIGAWTSWRESTND